MERFVGIDVGAETVKVVEVQDAGDALEWTRRARVDHHKDPAPVLRDILAGWGWDDVAAAGATGRLGRQLTLDRIPGKQARLAGHRFLHGSERSVVVDVGAHGFSVLVAGPDGAESFRENPRCSQGTGNFLRQLVERFGLAPDEADELASTVDQAAPLSGRCPVILKTDMTHLANKGEDRARILAGLFDAICENVQVLVKAKGPARAVLAGGVGQSRRVRSNFAAWLARRGMTLVEPNGDDALYLDALGCAVIAAGRPARLPPLGSLFRPPVHAGVEQLPALADSLGKVRRLTRPPLRAAGETPVLLGLDIGSTGSKAVAIDSVTRVPVWEAYVRTSGDPIAAAQTLVRDFTQGPCGGRALSAVGVTGSGREIVGSLMATCYGPDKVHVLNEIAAHAEGARTFDPRVDTIFEIGGQDAKYIRLQDGRVVDAAMNEACSAGTGSFIEEQGRRLGGLDARALGEEAIAADGCVALGQHCAVFMAEILDEAAAAGAQKSHIVAGLYDSVIQNYLNRVKGSRSVGQVIFCQGMPFAADALAAAVARQTGAEVIVPPSPGTVGALGIALLAAEAIGNERASARTEDSAAAEPLGVDVPLAPSVAAAAEPLGVDVPLAPSVAAAEPPRSRGVDPARFLAAKVERKEQFVCSSTHGCGGSGNSCRIDRLRTVVEGQRQAFTWGGACSLYDKGTRKAKLPDGAPDPFREREALVDDLIQRLGRSGEPTKRVAVAEAFQLKGLFPFFATFFRTLGLDLEVVRADGHAELRRGIEQANIPYCAPMQQYHGLAAKMAETSADFVFLPMLRDLPPVKDEKHTWLCPIVQGSTDVVRRDLEGALSGRELTPVFRAGAGFLEGEAFLASCRALAASVGLDDAQLVAEAHAAARDEQLRFEDACQEIGRNALARCESEGMLPIVVLGRAYTIHDDVLNSNVPALLREQGAVAVPVDCYPTSDETPLVPGAFWGYTQRILRVAHEVRRSEGVYSLFASNYACGPDSFTLHHYARLMEGKPYAIIETDGHAGDAGTKTRIEAFLHCVREDLRSQASCAAGAAEVMELRSRTLGEVAAEGSTVLVPPMGPESNALVAALRGYGLSAELLPPSTNDTIRLGRRHTSGKECLPMTVTLGALLERIQRPDRPERSGAEGAAQSRGLEAGRKFTFFMPGSNGPCRFGMYRQLHQMVVEKLGHGDRLGIWSPPDSDYFEGVPPGLGAIVLVGCTAYGLLSDAMRDTRPIERERGLADEIHDRYSAELTRLLERAAAADLSARKVLTEVFSGRLYGATRLLERFAAEMRAARDERPYPTVLMVGEIYVRSDPAANGYVMDELEKRGVRVRLEPVVEYLQHSEYNQFRRGLKKGVKDALQAGLRSRVVAVLQHAVSDAMGWPRHAPIEELVEAAAPYLRAELEHEAVLAVGLPVHAWRRREIDAAICVGPLECMPNKLAEAQLHHAAEQEGLLSITLSLNGDPLDPEVLDDFAYEVKERFRARTARGEARA